MQGVNWAAVLPWVVVAAVLAFRFRRMAQQTRLQPGRLWIIPAIYAVLIAGMILARPPSVMGWLALAAGLVLGSALGWWRGRFTQLEVHPEDGTLLMRQSPAAMILLLLVIFGRSALRVALGGAGQDIGTLVTISDAFLGFAAGFLGAYRVELMLRAKRLLAAAPARVFE